MFWTADNFARVTEGRWLTAPSAGQAALRLDGLCTDTRTLKTGQVFLALRGENHDAHDLLAHATDAGAAMLIVSDETKAATVADSGVATLLVSDTLTALQTLAAAYRDHLRQRGVTVIAVVGSNGKTTTRHLIHSVLVPAMPGSQSPKSFNNHIGVPLTLLAAKDGEASGGGTTSGGEATSGGNRFVVVEVGTNHPGEIDALGNIVRPDVVVLTSIGHEHMEFFGSLAGVAQEEASILRHLAPQGLAVLPGDAATLRHLAPALAAHPLPTQRVIRFGEEPTCEARLLNVQEQGPSLRFTATLPRFNDDARTLEPREFTLPMPGRHNAGNALMALVVGRWLGVSDATMNEALARATAVPMRMLVQDLPAGVTLLNDAYNANPDSVIAALHTLAGWRSPASKREGHTPVNRRIAILGDMRELGAQAPDLHRLVGRALATLPACEAEPNVTLSASGIDLAILIGELSLYTAEALLRHWPPQRVRTFVRWDQTLPATVAGLIQPGDVVLLKASRAVALERLIPAIEYRLSLTPCGNANNSANVQPQPVTP